MRILVTSVTPTCAILLLSACGGSSTSSQPFTLENLEQDFEAAVGNTIIDYELTSIPEGELSGTATFQGALLLPTSTTADEYLIGDITLNANFTEETLTGGADSFGLFSASNLLEIDRLSDGFTRQSNVSGELVLADGVTTFVPDLGYTLAGNLNGDLTAQNDELDVDLFFAGGIGRSVDSDALVSFGQGIGSIEGTDISITYGEETGIGAGLIVYAEQ